MKTLPAFSVCVLLAALASALPCRAEETAIAQPPAPAATHTAAPKLAPKQAGDKDAGAPRPGVPAGGVQLPPGMEMDPETKELQKELQKAQIRMQLRQIKAQAELAEMNEETSRLTAEQARDKARRDAARAAAQDADEKAAFELQLKLAAGARRNRELQAQLEALTAEAQLAQAKLAEETRRQGNDIKQAELVLAAKAVHDKVEDFIPGEMAYTDEPFKDGVLTLSDRRVDLNGPVTQASVKPVVDQIQFFANQSDKPIFLVIGASPGGSVAAGELVIKAMESSRAPVHVVVKEFAASMAATICTLAPHSYAYPNAIILHHQMSYGMGDRANITQHREGLRHADEWYQRLAGPVAKKMGVSVKEFVDQMYAKNSDGDWQEFADAAQKLHWVDHVVKEARDLGVREKSKPASMPEVAKALRGGLDEQVDAKGVRFVQLPHLEAHDCWFLSNRDGYYRP